MLHIRVQPRASRNDIRIMDDGRVRIAVTAPPVDAAANAAVNALLAKTFGVAKSNVTVTAGKRSRNKMVCIAGISAADVEEKLKDM